MRGMNDEEEEGGRERSEGWCGVKESEVENSWIDRSGGWCGEGRMSEKSGSHSG